jgi:hypothetical protein
MRALVPLAALALAACGSPAPSPEEPASAWFYLAEGGDGPTCAVAPPEMVADIPQDRRHYIREGVILLRGEGACEATAKLHRAATR